MQKKAEEKKQVALGHGMDTELAVSDFCFSGMYAPGMMQGGQGDKYNKACLETRLGERTKTSRLQRQQDPDAGRIMVYLSVGLMR